MSQDQIDSTDVEPKKKRKRSTKKKTSTKKASTKKASTKKASTKKASSKKAKESESSPEAEQVAAPERVEASGSDGGGNVADTSDANAADTNPADGEGKPKRRRRSRRRGRKKSGGGNGEGNSENNGEGRNGSQNQSNQTQSSRKPSLPPEVVTGIYEQGPKSDGRLRQLDKTFLSYPTDPVVGSHLVEKYGLRPGLMIEVELGNTFGGGQQHNNNQQRGGKKKKIKYTTIDPQARRVTDVLKIEGEDPAEYAKMRRFEDLTIIMPEPRIELEYKNCPPASRLIDLFCPIGYGTRGMIVSPPKAGKTTLLQDIAFSVRTNHPEIDVYALLIDERPEEVTEFRRNVPCTVWASSNDHTPERHCALAIAAIERCKRLAEMGKDVLVLLDSLTRVGRAFNTAPSMASTGRTLSGGLDAGALSIPKQLFGAARNFEEGGSLTIIATALVDTGSRGDQVIFEEFKGTGNMELILDRRIAEQRLFPAMDLAASGTRNENRLITNSAEFETINQLRRRLLNMNPVQQIEQLLSAVKRFETNADLVGNPQSPGNASSGASRSRPGQR